MWCIAMCNLGVRGISKSSKIWDVALGKPSLKAGTPTRRHGNVSPDRVQNLAEIKRAAVW